MRRSKRRAAAAVARRAGRVQRRGERARSARGQRYHGNEAFFAVKVVKGVCWVLLNVDTLEKSGAGGCVELS